jgi:CRISPR-associated endonuclease Cas2
MNLEGELRREIRNTKLQRAILGSLAVSGIVATGGLGVAMIGAFGKAFHLPRPDNIQTAAKRLANKGLVRFEKQKGRTFLVLTQKGAAYINHLHAIDFKLSTPARWDKKWRLVIFDIPEKRKRLRDVLRATLRRIGFIRLQDSAWVYPHDCEELITLLKTEFKVGKDVLYMIVDKIENDKIIRTHFKL